MGVHTQDASQKTLVAFNGHVGRKTRGWHGDGSLVFTRIEYTIVKKSKQLPLVIESSRATNVELDCLLGSLY